MTARSLLRDQEQASLGNATIDDQARQISRAFVALFLLCRRSFSDVKVREIIAMDFIRYHHLSDVPNDDFEKEKYLRKASAEEGNRCKSYMSSKGLFVVLIVSSLINLVLGLFILLQQSRTLTQQQHGSSVHDRTLYAGLKQDVPIARHEGAETLFGHPNRTIADTAWNNWEVNPGIVALPRKFIEEKSLPRAQDWPWDGDKGIYLINGYHNLHCLFMIRKTILAAVDGIIDELPESMFEHSLHCIESLRQDTLCNADDTPLYTGFNKEHLAGTMQSKMCRSWDKLEAWTRQYTACYRDVGRWVPGFKLMDRFKYCPEGYVFSATGSTIPPWDTGDGQLHGETT